MGLLRRAAVWRKGTVMEDIQPVIGAVQGEKSGGKTVGGTLGWRQP